MALTGVYIAYKKDGSISYRSSITYRNKHISLGSFDTEQKAFLAYSVAAEILSDTSYGISFEDYSTSLPDNCILTHDRFITLINFRDNNIYINTPIYLLKKHFIYYLDAHTPLKFDVDDLFYYSNHRIIPRNGYMYVNDYGMQTNILLRYGIRNHAVAGRDYNFANGNPHDFTYSNIKVINRYRGVLRYEKSGRILYKVKIHLRSDYVVGNYKSEKEAAIAYNKAVDILSSKGINKAFEKNYIEDITSIEYASIYNLLRISDKIRNYQG